MEQLKSYTFLRTFSFLTSFLLSLSLVLALSGVVGNILIQTITAATIILGTILEVVQILIVIQFTKVSDKIGWILHRFAYVTLLVMILSFLLVVGGTYASSFFVFGGDVMIIAVIGYVMQASFGICLASLTYHFLQIETVWQK